MSVFAVAVQDRVRASEPVDLRPWEPGDTGIAPPEPFDDRGLLVKLELRLIDLYQNRIGSRSVDRCPFLISCSHYAERAILSKGGVLGLLYWFDRYFIRENKASFLHYPRVVLDDGRVKIDDSWFIEVAP